MLIHASHPRIADHAVVWRLDTATSHDRLSRFICDPMGIGT